MSQKSHTAIYIAIAAALSLSGHLLLLMLADAIPVTTFSQALDEPETPLHKRPVITIFERPEVGLPDDDGDDGGTDSDPELAGDQKVKKFFEDTRLIVPPKPNLELSGLGANVVLPSPAAPAPAMPTAPRPALLAMNDTGLAADGRNQRVMIPDVPRTASDAPALPSFLADGPLSSGHLPSLKAGMRLSAPSTSLGAVDLPPLRPASNPEQGALPLPESLPIPPIPGPEHQGSHTPMDALLTVKLFQYLPPTGDGYFQIDVSPNPDSRHMRPIPKDVLLLVDCSASISPGKLGVFKEAVEFSLDFLNSRDRFNVVAFRAKPEPLFPTWQPVTETALRAAREYVRDISRGGKTDVYASLAPYVSQNRGDRRNPLLVYLLTDGKSTVKNSLENEEFIRKVADINQADVTIYSASAGEGANRFLLDLLSYSNRGLPLHREKYRDYDKILAKFMGDHNDIIVADLAYDLSGTLEEHIYPRRLPHLYRGDTLSIYGRFPRDLKTIGLRLTGVSAEGQLRELVYQGDLATADRKSSDLAFDWIGQKVFDLVIRNVLDPRPEHAQEIRRLKQKYDLQIPYF
ncbi:MAG: VWA domain-containing protein [Lentisphaeria bacterium]|nr:VWA domain-containing protein [Lentisphaeria bacterium]